ncbi:MAG: acyl-CoA dehydrogenase [Acidimicrobiia bacterium]
MDLFPTPEQALLADTAADFVARSVDTDRVRELEASDEGFDPGLWATMCDLGWTDLGPVELALVAEQLGRGAVPSPLVTTGALRNALPALAAALPADAGATLAALVPGATHEGAGPHPALDGATVTGRYLLVPYAPAARALVVTTADGLATVDPRAGGVTLGRQEVIGGDACWRVDLEGAPATPIPGDLGHVLDHLGVAALAYTVGAAEGALALSVQHAKDRHQFGRPIGSFQAVAHRCADMRAEVEACRMLAWRAAWSLDQDAAGHGDRGRVRFAVDGALAYANDALRRVAMHAHQVHGAIGFSTEHDLHLFTRRIKAFELSYGGTALHQDRFAASLGLRW